ncbi:hypothetical protein PAHAL_9G494900 [Panicum hallii]|nr:uncharacterized protein LOC112873808 [Panicum hallii]PAN50055.1 hypothetical protein PAHAL_9G494900 [Panicum hallii]
MEKKQNGKRAAPFLCLPLPLSTPRASRRDETPTRSAPRRLAMAAADYDRAYHPDAAPATAGEFDRPYRNEVVPYGDRRLDIVVKPPARSPPPPLPASTRSGGGAGSAWCFSDPEMKRRRRVASYKAYSVEGKVKASLRRGFRWIKAKCSELIHG